MDRRTYLRAVGVGSLAASAGCLSSVLGGSGPQTVLEPPENQRYDSEELPYPAYGQNLPEFSLPDPLTGKTVHSAEIDKTLVVTGFFASCPAECIRLVNQLAGVQGAINEQGLADEVTFLAITFDPQRDDAETLRTYGEQMGVDLEAGNWHFLRPNSVERAKEVVNDRLGIKFDKVGADQSQRIAGYDFQHLSLTFLRNPYNVVERIYRTYMPDHEQVVGDATAVVEKST
ncbi:SCO family protein [Halobacteriales archaeon Cl-PHB]